MINSARKSFLVNLALTLFAAFLFSLAHPGFINSQGIAFFGFITLIPVFYVIRNSRARQVWIFGFIFGVLDYVLFVYWFIQYAWYFLAVICFIYGIYNAAVFVLLRYIFILLEKNRASAKSLNKYISDNIINFFTAIAFASLWVVYEKFKDSFFLGLSYGLIGYTQWKNPLLLQTASFGGVWFVSFYLALFSAAVAFIADDFIKINSLKTRKTVIAILEAVRNNESTLVIFIALSVTVAIYGSVKIQEENNASGRYVKIAAVQNNCDPWLNGVKNYEKNIRSLRKLTDAALEKDPDIQLVVWPETAVVSPIVWNYTEKKDYERYQLITNLLEYFNSKECAFVTGNQHSVKGTVFPTDDYNSALLFDSKKGNVLPPDPVVYKKNHLVPFTEYFPYGKIFPKFYKLLLEGDTHLWEPGKEATVFESRGVRFSTPICFEDTFGNLTRRFFVENNNGPDVFINISNDAWAHNAACQYQHLSMAAFRSAESRIPTVRSTASGVTCYVDSTGRVVKEAPSFEQTSLTAEVKIKSSNKISFYNRHGDYLPVVMLIFLAILAAEEIIRQSIVAKKSENEVK